MIARKYHTVGLCIIWFWIFLESIKSYNSFALKQFYLLFILIFTHLRVYDTVTDTSCVPLYVYVVPPTVMFSGFE